jgi:DGQHR domain-containing protein
MTSIQRDSEAAGERKSLGKKESLVLNALMFKQGGARVYNFAIPGDKLSQIADLSRIKRGGRQQRLEGFQRPEIQQHVRQITDYLDKGPGLFPNAVILALCPQVSFTRKRGGKNEDLNVAGVEAGKLVIPVLPQGEKVAWIVDGQQRSIALSKSKNGDLLVPVVAFESASIETHREQFILVNRARPLSQRLINELLPETDDTLLPRDLAANKVPSEICNLLNTKPSSPLYRRIARVSERPSRPDVIIDSAIIKMIRERVNGTSGALLHLRGDGRRSADVNEMYRLLGAYWAAVAATFPDAWKLSPDKSRLTAAAGITVMGVMMDRISARIGYGHKNPQAAYQGELAKIAKDCAWTTGAWPEIGMAWNALEMTNKSAGRIIQLLGALYVRAGSA